MRYRFVEATKGTDNKDITMIMIKATLHKKTVLSLPHDEFLFSGSLKELLGFDL